MVRSEGRVKALGSMCVCVWRDRSVDRSVKPLRLYGFSSVRKCSDACVVTVNAPDVDAVNERKRQSVCFGCEFGNLTVI